MLCPVLGTCRGPSSSPGHLPTELAFLESSPCCRLAGPEAPAAPRPRHQRCHQPEAEQGENPAVPGLLPPPGWGCRAQNKTRQSNQLCLGSRARVCVSVKRRMGVLLLPCHTAWLCPAATAGCWWVPPAKGVRVSVRGCLVQFGYGFFFLISFWGKK